jgi:hypothetical protein
MDCFALDLENGPLVQVFCMQRPGGSSKSFFNHKKIYSMKKQNKSLRKLKLNKATVNNLTTEMQSELKGGSAKCVQYAAGGDGTCASMINTSCTGSGRPACI